MANLKDIKTRIGAVKKTKQITSAMKLVAAAKLKRASDKALAARPYREQLSGVLGRVAAAAGEDVEAPLLKSRPEVKRILVITLSSDKGLCGPFNNALVRKGEEWLQIKREQGIDITMRVYGKKGVAGIGRGGWTIEDKVVDYGKVDPMDLVRPLASDAVAKFLDGEVDEVWLMYNRFVNTLVQLPTYDRVLPMSVDPSDADDADADADAAQLDYRYEPSAGGILETLLPLYLRTLVLQAFLETEAGEHAARMTAMENATRNASDLIDRLSLEYNRARQAAITTEIIEIVSGAAAL